MKIFQFTDKLIVANNKIEATIFYNKTKKDEIVYFNPTYKYKGKKEPRPLHLRNS